MNKSYYFQHDYNAAEDFKISALRIKHGMQGYGVYWYTIERLAQANGKLPVWFIPMIASQACVPVELAQSVVRDFDLFVIEDEFFFSNRLLGQIKFRMNQKEAGRIGGIRSGKARKRTVNEAPLEGSLQPPLQGPLEAPLEQRKGKERKEKKSKEKDIKESIIPGHDSVESVTPDPNGLLKTKSARPLKNYVEDKDPILTQAFGIAKKHWLEVVHPGWDFGGMQGKSLKELLGKIRRRVPDADRDVAEIIAGYFGKMCEKLPAFFQDKDLNVLNSKFNEIIDQIRNKNEKANRSSKVTFDDVTFNV